MPDNTEGTKFSPKWTAFLNDANTTLKTVKACISHQQNLFLLPIEEGLPAVFALSKAAEKYELSYSILLAENVTDIPKVAEKFETTKDIIFGRLYYGMNHKYGYEKIENEQKVKVPIYTPVCGELKNAINLPMLISVLAGLQEQLSYLQKSLLIGFGGILIASMSLVHSCNQSESNTEKDRAIVKTLNQISISNKQEQR